MHRAIFLAFSIGLISLAAQADEQTVAKDPWRFPGERPIIAIWQANGGMKLTVGECLRVAIWNDGSVALAKDPSKWDREFQTGKISQARIAQLKKAILDSGVFELRGTTYLVPDAPTDCIMIDLGEKTQMLYWDEREMPGYGINVNPKPRHVEFMRCWKMVNHLALLACPDQFAPGTQVFNAAPRSWRLKPPIQSE